MDSSSASPRHLLRWAAAAYLLMAMVAGTSMLQASQLLGLVQSEGQSAYTMNDLVRPPVPVEDDRVVAALESWRTAAVPIVDGTTGVDEQLLGLVRSSIGWHVGLDLVLFAPAVALVLLWLVGRSFPDARLRWRLALPGLYLVVDWLETAWTWQVADDYLVAGEGAALSGTTSLVWLTAAKWFLLLVCVLVVVMGSLVRPSRFRDARLLARLLWSVRVQVFAVSVLAVLVALPVSGPLDQIPDLLRSAHDESWRSSEVWNPALLLVAFSALLWSTGMLIVREIPTEDPALEGAGQDSEEFQLGPGHYLRSRLPWILLTGALAVGAIVLVRTADEELRPSAAVWAAAAVAAVLLVLDLLLALLARIGNVTRIDAGPPLLRSADERPLEWVVVVLAGAPLAIGGLGAVRAYAPLVLLQSGDATRAAHGGATAWFWFGAGSAVLAPLVAVVLLRRLAPRDGSGRPQVRNGGWHAALVAVVLAGGSVLMTGLAVWAGVDPADAGASLEAHGILTVWLGLVVAFLGLLQWVSEKREPVALARVIGLARTPWIALVVLVPLVAGSMDTDVGYHAVTLEDEESHQDALETAFARWHEQARECRGAGQPLPLVLVAAPGGGARAAYWTGQVMARLQARDACGGRSIFAATGVSGGSVGLAVWSATSDEGTSKTQESLEALVGPEALSATVAALLFRDLPRAFIGIHPHEVDRAAVEQDVWIEKVPALGDDFFAQPDTGEWQPLLVLNGSDIASGCKVLVSQLEVQSSAHPVSAQTCKQHPSGDGEAPASLQAGSVDAARFLEPADCPDDEGGETSAEPGSAEANLSFAAAALLSARFPYVSPSGAMTACGAGAVERLFVADGGYLENSGLHTLLALWQDLEPLVAEQNEAGGPRIVPVAVLVENHYRSAAVLRAGERVRELTGPPQADRTALVSSEALEQALAAEFGQPVGDVASDTRRWFVIAPSTHPDVSAPLGWSLSTATRTELDCQIPHPIQAAGDDDTDCADQDGGTDIQPLVDLLTGPEAG